MKNKKNQKKNFNFAPVFRNPLYIRVISILSILMISYAIFAGLTFPVPDIGGNLAQTSRNLFYHVPMWFTMYWLMGVSVFQSIQYLRSFDVHHDLLARESALTGIFFGFLGLFTGSVWSRVTWGEAIPASDFTAWWAWDPKQTLALVAIMVYLAYFLLRSSFENQKDSAKISAIYNIFAAVSLIPLTLIIPKMIGGLHPGGSEGSPVFNTKDISTAFRIVFYPSIIGFICLGTWLTSLRFRLALLNLKINEKN